MIFTNLTRGNEIGANSYLLDFEGDGRIVLDAGMHPRGEGIEGLPMLEKLRYDSVGTILVSHAHHDHTGSLPLLMREQPGARVFLSEATYYLAEPLLHNSVQVMLRQKEEKGIAEYPLFTHRELDQLVKVWQACGLNRPWSPQGYPDPDNEPLTFDFHDAGHILGSVGTAIRHRGRTIFYAGDVNFTDQTIMRAAEFPRKDIDVLITETTRGAQPRPENFSREAVVERLAVALEETFAKGGAVLMPVFAMGKTQELLAQLHFLQKMRRLPQTPIYIGGLGRSFCDIYDRSRRPLTEKISEAATARRHSAAGDGWPPRARFQPEERAHLSHFVGHDDREHALEYLRAGISRPRPAQHFLRRLLRS